MAFFCWKKSLYTVASVAALCTHSATAKENVLSEGDVLNLDLSTQHLWDDNFSRSPEPISEEITTSSAGLLFNKKIQKQKFHLSWRAVDYTYAEREDLDAVTQEGAFKWLGQWGERIHTGVEWTRGAHIVDRLEFIDKDIVVREDAKAMIGYGSGDRLTISIGARQTNQKHWNDLREDLDFDEEEAFIETTYKTALKSTFTLRLKSGERVYPIISLTNPRNLDYTYDQVELDSNWVLSPKTSISGLIAYYVREGEINDGNGGLVDLGFNWSPSEKLLIFTRLEYKQPAVGEIADAPSEIKTGLAGIDWQITEKVKLGTDVRYSHQTYDQLSIGTERIEKLTNYSPLAMSYSPWPSLKIRVDTALVENQSPLYHRDFKSKQVSLGINWRF
ncbi:MAG: hypothetical protein EOP48_09570 [Sphingobacteriales bacterium]|nr:MAG: hypothetical protein EOP48_09570 [Sphingobacteriales bacterium]